MFYVLAPVLIIGAVLFGKFFENLLAGSSFPITHQLEVISRASPFIPPNISFQHSNLPKNATNKKTSHYLLGNLSLKKKKNFYFALVKQKIKSVIHLIEFNQTA